MLDGDNIMISPCDNGVKIDRTTYRKEMQIGIGMRIIDWLFGIKLDTHSIPEIIFSYSSHHGTWSSFFAFWISCVFFVVAAILIDYFEMSLRYWWVVLAVIYRFGCTACHWRGKWRYVVSVVALSYQDRRWVELQELAFWCSARKGHFFAIVFSTA
jgi:hypothetical protein